MSKTHSKLIIGNWKMHGSLESNAELILGLLEHLGNHQGVDTAVCVPFPYLPQIQTLLANTNISYGAQDISAHNHGAYTGEVSGHMLQEFACQWVLCGHSERRAYHGETSAQVAAKVTAALHNSLSPIVCIGETMTERESNLVEQVIASQLEPVLSLNNIADMANLVIAYEPVWAIGTGHTASPEQAQQVHAFIRSELKQYGLNNIRIIYGGSVKPENAAALFAQPDIDGALVGGASLDAKTFANIVLAANL